MHLAGLINVGAIWEALNQKMNLGIMAEQGHSVDAGTTGLRNLDRRGRRH